MAPKDVRQDDGGAGGGGGGTGASGGAAGKRTLTQGIVQKKDSLGFEPEPKWKMPDGGLPKDLQPVEPTKVSDAIDAFRRALDAGDGDEAKQRWHGAKAADRKAWAGGATFERELGQVKRVCGTYLLQVMEDAGITFAQRPGLLRELLRDKSAKNNWLAALSHHPAMWKELESSLSADRDAMTEDEGKNIGKIMLAEDGMNNVKNDLEVVKKLFAFVYAPLRDDPYNTQRVKTRPWKIEWITRLYKVLSSHLPIGHVRTVKDFAVGYEEKQPTETKWKTLKNAWWNKDRHVILNERSAKAEDGGGTSHNMTGGSNDAITKFDVSALHEVGHGVGQELGGNDWAMAHPWVGWKIKMDIDEWSKGLWGSDGDLKNRAQQKLGAKADVLDASEARKYLAARIAKEDYTVTTPGFAKPKDVEAFIRKHYAEQKLTKYWEKVIKGERKTMYKFEDDDNIGDDDRVYVYLTRGPSHLSSYNAQAYRKKISLYSTSSPKEWFAEQYAHYYRLTPHGQGLEAGTKDKLDELHGKNYPKDKPAPNNGLMNPNDADADTGSSADDGAGDRLPFPW
jgi:hypothetical protein